MFPLWYYRKMAGLTHKAIGERCGVSISAVSLWETGKTVRPPLIRQSEDLLAAMLSPLRAIRRRTDSIAGNRPRQFSYWRGFFASLSDTPDMLNEMRTSTY
mgnify:CR=1 FL=1